VNGKPIVRDGRSLTLNETEILKKAAEYGAQVMGSVGMGRAR
jgi:hypothetical protein